MNWLRRLASRLREAYRSARFHREDNSQYLDFLLEVLRAISDSNGSQEVIYPLLRANTDKLNDTFAELFRWWAPHTLAKAETDTVTSIAANIFDFSYLIQQFPLGSKASNIEIAIAGYESVLTIYTREAFPQNWATTQNNLGIAYKDRIKGDKANNIENAIGAYNLALTVTTREAFPQDWAMTQNNLGIAYSHRIKGDKANNIENAIGACNLALTVTTREAFPQDWAMTQNSLGNAYSHRINGDKANNIENAIGAYELALTVRTREAFPQNHANTLFNLGILYQEERQFLCIAIIKYSGNITFYCYWH